MTDSLVDCKLCTMMPAGSNCVESPSWGEAILPIESANIWLKKGLHLPALKYDFVSTGHLTDNGIEPRFRRVDVVLELGGSREVVEKEHRDEDLRMYVLLSPLRHQDVALESVTNYTELTFDNDVLRISIIRIELRS